MQTGYGPLARQEQVKIIMELEKSSYDSHRESVTALCPHFTAEVIEGDTLKVNYDFGIDYYGDVVTKLSAVQEICSDPAVVVNASCEELEQGRILAYEVLKRLDAVIAEIRNRKKD